MLTNVVSILKKLKVGYYEDDYQHDPGLPDL